MQPRHTSPMCRERYLHRHGRPNANLIGRRGLTSLSTVIINHVALAFIRTNVEEQCKSRIIYTNRTPSRTCGWPLSSDARYSMHCWRSEPRPPTGAPSLPLDSRVERFTRWKRLRDPSVLHPLPREGWGTGLLLTDNFRDSGCRGRWSWRILQHDLNDLCGVGFSCN